MMSFAFIFRYLESTVGGPEKFEPFLKMYLEKYKFKSIDTDVFKTEFEMYFAKNLNNLEKIDWNKWLNEPGMPPKIPEYDRSLVEICEKLKKKWINFDENSGNFEETFGKKDISEMNSNQIDHFLQLLLEHDIPLSISKLEIMDKIYNLSNLKNAEIKFRWLRLAIKSKWLTKLDDVLKMVTEVGRMKFIRPLYQDLYNWAEARPKAIQTFNQNKKCMMHVSAYTVSKDLHLAE